MTKIKIGNLEPINATKAKTIFGGLLYQTSVEGKRYVIERHGKPISVILSYKDYCQLLAEKSGIRVKGSIARS